MATVIPGPLRCRGPAGGGRGRAGGSARARACVCACVAAGGGADGVSGGLSPWAVLRGGADVCDRGSLARTGSDALLLEERRVWGTRSPVRVLFGGRGVTSRPATPGVGERLKRSGGAGGLGNLSEAHTTFVLACGVRVTCLFLICVWICVQFILVYTRYLWIFGSLSVRTCPLELCIACVLCLDL